MCFALIQIIFIVKELGQEYLAVHETVLPISELTVFLILKIDLSYLFIEIVKKNLKKWIN